MLLTRIKSGYEILSLFTDVILIDNINKEVIFSSLFGDKHQVKSFANNLKGISYEHLNIFMNKYDNIQCSLKNCIKLSSNNVSSESMSYSHIIVGNDDVMKNIVFLNNNKNSEEEIKELVLKKIKESIPYPILSVLKNTDELIKSLIDKAKNSKFELLSGNKDISGFLDFSFIENDAFESEIQSLIVKMHGREEFIEAHGRAPMVSSAWKMIDVKRFNVKSFSELLKRFGGKDAFEEIDPNIQESIIYMYEVFGVEAHSIYKVFTSDVWFFSWKDFAVNQRLKGSLKLNIKTLVDIIIALKDKKIVLNGLIQSIYESDDLLNIVRRFNSSKKADREYIEEFSLAVFKECSSVEYDIKPGGEAIAIVASELLMSNSSFLTYQDEYIKNIKNVKRAKQYPTVSGKVDSQYSWEAIDMSNPRAWVVGLETNCCQHLESVGGSCVLYAAAHPELSGIFRVMKKGSTVAQSFFWFNQETGDFVFDNIEVLGGELRDAIKFAYQAYIRELEKRKELFGVKRVSFGTGYSDVNWDLPTVSNKTTISTLPDGASVYSDANSTQLLLAEF